MVIEAKQTVSIRIAIVIKSQQLIFNMHIFEKTQNRHILEFFYPKPKIENAKMYIR